MNSTKIITVETCVHQNKIIIALDPKWLVLNGGQPPKFEVRRENDRLVLVSVDK